MRLEYAVLGTGAVQTHLAHLKDAARVDAVLATAALELERRIKFDAPVDTGRLRSATASHRFGRLAHGVSIEVHYGAFPEFGTGQAGAASPQPDPGVPAGYSFGPSPGQPAKPYVRPNVAEIRDHLQRPDAWDLL